MNNFVLTRAATAAAFDSEALEIEAVIATRHPVSRRDARGTYSEILDPAGMVLEGDDLPLLADHNPTARNTIGRAFDVRIEGESVVARLRFSGADDVRTIWQRVQDGTLTTFSAGYSVSEWQEGKDANGNRTRTAVRWHLREVSIVPIPADPHAKKRGNEMPFDTPEARDLFVENIRNLAGLPDAWGDDLPEDADENAIRAAAREALTQRSAPRIRVQRDHTDPAQIQTRAADALAYRMGGRTDLPEASREYVGMTLMDHMRDAVSRTGVSTRGLSPDEIMQRALTTSDFPQTVANAANKTAAQGYTAAESALKPLFRQRPLSDFKTSASVRLGGMGELSELTESGEITAVSRSEEGETLSLRTFARRIDLTRKLIINDDLGLFGDTTRALGTAAAQTEARLMADKLTGSDVLSDGQPLFHASRSNIVTYDASGTRGETYGAMLDALSNARKTLRNQKDLDGKTFISARPKYIVAGPESETLLGNILDYDQNYTTSLDVLTWRKEISPLIDPRITDDTVYLVADPASVPVFNQAIFSAAPGVQIQRQEAWDTLGVSFRAWLDCGTGFAGWRGIIKIEAV